MISFSIALYVAHAAHPITIGSQSLLRSPSALCQCRLSKKGADVVPSARPPAFGRTRPRATPTPHGNLPWRPFSRPGRQPAPAGRPTGRGAQLRWQASRLRMKPTCALWPVAGMRRWTSLVREAWSRVWTPGPHAPSGPPGGAEKSQWVRSRERRLLADWYV